jgi:hypothetical protein
MEKHFMNKFLPLALLLAACNSVYIKPGATLDKDQVFFADRGGYSMKRSVKELMDERGYKVVVGKAIGNRSINANSENWESLDMGISDIMNARYIVKVSERSEKFGWYWCMFNGFWWWNFNMSIADQKTGEEIMAWRGRGCANSTLRKLNRMLDELEE